MHIDILGIVEEAIHIKSWKIPWVFRKEEGERNFNSSLSFFLKKMIFAVFSPFMLSSAALFLVFFGMVANVWCSFFSSRPFYPQSRSVVYSVFLACNYIAQVGRQKRKGRGKKIALTLALMATRKKKKQQRHFSGRRTGQKVTLCKKRICLLLSHGTLCYLPCFLPS